MQDHGRNPADESRNADAALQDIIQGFQNFHQNVYPQQQTLFKRLAKAQQPHVMVITCADSRIALELITQSAPGTLFVTRNVGNVVPPYGQMNGGVSTAIEYAVLSLGVKHIIICGHSDCGAMKAVLNPASLDGMPTVRAWLRHAEVARSVVETNCGCAGHDTLGVLTEENVVAQLDHLRTHPSVAARLASGQLNIHGWVYDIESCTIRAYDAAKRRFLPLDGNDVPSATPQPRYANA
ncbi:carbonic anhydrase [Halomonas binhaiensis]|uniref:carbonic anhydrase n=1 Tax=Halomonas binhaiensis TaxID=2562282 RepID=UPI0011EF8531|nr:carbonic anhydrase [Halomonas binhaiensis]